MWNQDGLKFSYQWLRDGQAIRGATGPEYRVGFQDQLKNISVTVTGTTKSGQTGTATSQPVRVKAAAAIVAIPAPVVGSPTTQFKVNVQVRPLVAGTVAEGQVIVVVEGKAFVGTLSGGRAVVTLGRYGRGIPRDQAVLPGQRHRLGRRRIVGAVRALM